MFYYYHSYPIYRFCQPHIVGVYRCLRIGEQNLYFEENKSKCLASYDCVAIYSHPDVLSCLDILYAVVQSCFRVVHFFRQEY